MKEYSHHTSQVNLNYAEGPNNGLPLLLLPGGSARWQSFDILIPDLISQYHVYALDLRGHGKSGWVPKSYRLHDYVPDIASLIQDCIKEPAIIFGHSLGGEIGLMTAAYHPELVKGLIIGDSPLSRHTIFEHLTKQREMTKLWRDWAKSGSAEKIAVELKNMMIPVPEKDQPVKASEIFGENHPWFDSMAISLSQNDPDMLSSVFEDYESTFEKYDPDNLLPSVNCPTLIIRGGQDKGSLIPDSDATHALNLLKNGEEMKIPHVGHALFMEDKDSVAKAIIDFIKRL